MKKVLKLISISILLKLGVSIELNVENINSINEAAKLVSQGILDYYPITQPGHPIGLFQQPYYWWESGAAWGSLLDYWFYTGDEQYNTLVKQALLSQVGEHWDYVPLNQSLTEGNDDQGFWGITVMAAAERNFSNPNVDEPQWLFLAQAVFNTMTSRWEEDHCGGGLRWQIFKWNSGYDYKNSVSNGCLFQIASRLARFTGNQTYVEWAHKVWDWMEDTELIDGNGYYLVVFDGAFTGDNCTKVTPLQWSYNIGLLLAGVAYIYDFTKDSIWQTRLYLLLNGVSVFFKEDIMFEATCQDSGKCNNDQRSFKAYLARFLGLTAQLVPETRDLIDTYLRASAMAAALSCSGGYDGFTCGLNWQIGGNDNIYGLGEQMSALEVIQNLNYKIRPSPLTQFTGASSEGDPNAGWTRENITVDDGLYIPKRSTLWVSLITAGVGVSIITLAIIIFT